MPIENNFNWVYHLPNDKPFLEGYGMEWLQSLKFKTGARRLLFICAALARMVRKTVYLWKHSNNGCEHMICLLLIVLL